MLTFDFWLEIWSMIIECINGSSINRLQMFKSILAIFFKQNFIRPIKNEDTLFESMTSKLGQRSVRNHPKRYHSTENAQAYACDFLKEIQSQFSSKNIRLIIWPQNWVKRRWVQASEEADFEMVWCGMTALGGSEKLHDLRLRPIAWGVHRSWSANKITELSDWMVDLLVANTYDTVPWKFEKYLPRKFKSAFAGYFFWQTEKNLNMH